MNERIKELRKALGLTLEKFGERLGVSRAALSNIENGNRSVTDQMFKSVCREFSINEEWLRTGEGNMFLIPDDEDAALVSEVLENPDVKFYQMMLNMVRTYKQLSPESKKVVEDFIDQLLENSKNRKD